MNKLDSAVDGSPAMKASKTSIKKFFKIAKSSSHASDWPKHKLGAVITYKHRVLSIGWNTSKETPMQKKFNRYRRFDPATNKNSSHAEMNALIKLLRNYDPKDIDFSKLSIFIYREHKNGDLALAKPCPACEAALKSLGIQHIYYTGNQSVIYETYYKE